MCGSGTAAGPEPGSLVPRTAPGGGARAVPRPARVLHVGGGDGGGGPQRGAGADGGHLRGAPPQTAGSHQAVQDPAHHDGQRAGQR